MNKTISIKLKYYYLFFTLGIVLYHARFANYNVYFLNSLDENLFYLFSKCSDEIGGISMTFFFFMSGFWFFRNTNSLYDYLKKIKKYFITLIFPYFIWQFIAILYHANIHDFDFGLSNLFCTFILDPINGPVWYLLGIYILYLVTFIFFIFDNKVRHILISIMVLYFTLVNTNLIYNPFDFGYCWWLNNLISYCHIYLLGGLFSVKLSKYLLHFELNNKRYYLGALFVLVFFIFRKFGPMQFVSFYYLLIIFGSWFLLDEKLFVYFPKFLDTQFIIYVSHSILINKILSIFTEAFIDCWISGVAFISLQVFLLIAVIVLAFIIKIFLKNIFSEIAYKLITGGR